MMTKRGANEGSIYLRRDGRWAAATSTGDGRRKYVYGRTQAEVTGKLRKAQQALAQGLQLADERITVGGFLERWLDESARPVLRPKTYELYEAIVGGHLTPALGRTRLAKLTPDAVQSYMNQKIESGLSPYTVRNHHAVLRRALGQAERWGLLPRNVARLVSPPRAPREEVRPFTPEQARAFLDAVRGDRFEALYHVALALGLRQGEALGLTWDDVDLDASTLTVRHSLQRHDGEYRLIEPKTLRSRRTVGLPSQIAETLRRHRTQQREDRLRAGPGWKGERWGLLFCREDGEPLSSAVVTHRFQATLRTAGLPRQRFHDLRHAAASFMLAQSVPLRVVMEVLGHSEIGTTANIYGHIMPEMSRDATDRVGALLWARS